jgi:hypothetical protein
MNSDLLTRWTAIITNIAIVIGLVFVGLEFRNNTKTVEAERLDTMMQASFGVESLTLENADLAEIIYRASKDPDSLSDSDLDRAQHWLMLHWGNLLRTRRAHEAGLVSDDIYDRQLVGAGFMFSSDIGLKLIAIMRASSLDDAAWELLSESAENARAFCLNPKNECVARYDATQGGSS